MTKPITDLNDAFDLFFESGTAHLRLKEGLTLEDLLDAKLEKRKFPILEKHACKKIQRLIVPSFWDLNPLRN